MNLIEIVDSYDITDAETLNKAFKEGKGIKDYSFLSVIADSEGLLGYWSCEIDKLRKFCY